MGLIFKAWGLDGSLQSLNDFARWHGNGVQDDIENVTPEILGDRSELVHEDGAAAVVMRRHAGDPIAGFGKRTEFAANGGYSHLHDWVGEGVAGADAARAVRWYRTTFKTAPGFPTAFLASSGSWCILTQIHQVEDDSPADTVGNPSLQIGLSQDGFGRVVFIIRRNIDTDPTSTVYVKNTHTQEIVTWPYREDEWQDILIQARWSYSSAGYCTIYRNRRPIFIETGAPNTPNNSPARGGGGNYDKFGIYTSEDAEMEVYQRGIIIGDHAATFADMYPELPGAVPLERVSGPVAAGGAW